MRSILSCLLLLSVMVAVFAQAKKDEADARSWFTTFTLITGTSTSTSTFTSTATCTTSTAALTTCTGGRRRRGLFYEEGENNGKHRRGLLYDDSEADNVDGSIFISNPVKRAAKDEAKPAKVEKTSPVVGLEVQSGFTLPEGLNSNRFGLAFGQTTTTSITTTTSTSTLTATCASTTNFPTCGTSGK